MKVTVNEALRLRNEMREAKSDLEYKDHDTYATQTLEQAQPTIGDYTTNDWLDDSYKLGQFILGIEGAIAQFNVDSGITVLVKGIKFNNSFMSKLKKYTTAKERTESRRVRVGEEIVEQPVKMIPVLKGSWAKARLKELRKQNREWQSEIEKLNAQEIVLPFEYKEIEDYV